MCPLRCFNCKRWLVCCSPEGLPQESRKRGLLARQCRVHADCNKFTHWYVAASKQVTFSCSLCSTGCSTDWYTLYQSSLVMQVAVNPPSELHLLQFLGCAKVYNRQKLPTARTVQTAQVNAAFKDQGQGAYELDVLGQASTSPGPLP